MDAGRFDTLVQPDPILQECKLLVIPTDEALGTRAVEH